MALDEAREHVGDTVVYRNHGCAEVGEITSVNDRYVFVRYGDDASSKATDPSALTLGAVEVARWRLMGLP
jgi:hypothetical protein